MKDPISWDPSLVKKYSSSNYYKLLNQLRNEVKKYPLKNKKKISSTQSKEFYDDNTNTSHDLYSQNNSSFYKSNNIDEVSSSNTNVSFNNAKNFSIYSNNSNPHIEKLDSELPNSREDNSSKTFIDRLNKIDMK